MRKQFSLFFATGILALMLDSNAQNCNNWLHIPNSQSYVTIGDLDVTGNQITVEGMFSRDSAFTELGFTSLNVVSKHLTPADVNYLLRVDRAQITTTNGHFVTPNICETINKKIYYVAMTYDGSALKFYRNGFLESQITCTGTMIQNDYPTTIAATANSPTTNTQLIGYLNEIRIWNVVKTQAELKSNMNSPLINPTTQNGLLAYFTFDDLLNKQGNNLYNAILHGNASFNAAVPNCNFYAGSCPTTPNVAGISGIINNYTPVLAFNPCTNKLTVEEAAQYNAGDTVLIMQMKGAVIDSSNTSTFGTVTDYSNAGNYEFNYVKSKAGNVIELKNVLTRQYNIPTGKVQLIRVPYFEDIILSDTLTCLPWDGKKGGILVLNAANKITMNADINVSGKGFRGGLSKNPFSNTLTCATNDFSYPNTSIISAEKGESIHETGLENTYGKGANANGGGGGNGHNSGGGGGSNSGSGGLGGYQLEACGNSPFDNRGFGGKPLDLNNITNKIFLGGGGGSGHTDNVGGINMNGGNGGGMAIIITNSLTNNGYKIISNGTDAQTCNNSTNNCHDGSGGGGAAGTVLIKSNSYINNLSVETNGGKGGSLVIYNLIGAGRIGPGGGGGGGVIWLAENALPSIIIPNSTGGSNGTIIEDNNNSWGATPGQNGSTLFNLKIPVATIPFKTNIDSIKIKDSLTSCKSFDFKGLAYTNVNAIQTWNWNFGDGATARTQNTSHSYANNGTYIVKLLVTDINGCIDSISKSILVLRANFDFTQRQDACNPLQVIFKLTDSTFTNPSWTFGDGTGINNRNSTLHSYADTGLYLVKLTVQKNGCIDSIQKNIIIGYVSANIILTPDTTICFGNTLQLKTQFDTTLQFCWSPANFLNGTAFAQPTTSSQFNITYTLLAAANTSNLITNGNFNAGNTSFTTDYITSATSPAIAAAGNYLVANTSSNAAALASSCHDHTSGNGNMLLVRSNNIADAAIWSQTISIQPNTNYEFSTWILSFLSPGNAKLQLSINGNSVGDTIISPAANCVWKKYHCIWNSGNTNTAVVSILNKNSSNANDYFALDDISFLKYFIQKDTVKITIDNPVVKATNDTLICAASMVQLLATGAASFAWLPAAAVNNANISNPIATVLDTTQYIVKGTTLNGCIAIDTVNIFTKPLPVITKSADTAICKNITVQLFANGAASYQWLPAGSLSNASIANPVASPTVTTSYRFTATGINGCINKDSVKITVNPDPVFTISPDDSTCFNTPVQLKATGGNQYSWSPASLISNATIANPFASNTAGSTYTVIIRENVCNTIDTLSTTITVINLPNVKATKLNDVDCASINAQLLGTGAVQYLWQPAATLNSNAVENPLANPTSTTLYTVTGTDLVTKCASTDTVTVFVNKSGEAKYFIPEAFTPNGDRLNDCWKISIMGNLTEFELSVYNRFGELVFFTKNTNACWDGTFKGKAQNAGNFVYTLKAKNLCREDAKKGNFLLIR
ncbi:PKD domain-containing protein [Ferruginibacter sp.]|uniref:PKD domain-containing protein n=1 Tax=Ferruginibacter sp. TaxID=1940288 RepID=UPI00374D9512